MAQYLINTSAIWLICLIVFDIFLRKESYHGYNRFYLIGTFLLGLVVPLVSWEGSALDYTSQLPVARVVAVRDAMATAGTPASTFNWENYVFYLYLGGVAVSFLFLLADIFKVMALYRRGKKTRDGSCVVVETNSNHGPFSLFNSVFVGSRSTYSTDEWNILKTHEQRHGSLLHFADVLLLQLGRIAFWFHPLVYVYQKRLLLVHEYQADAVAVASTSVYGRFLVSQSMLSIAPAISHSFNRSPIKKRIIMLTKKSKGLAKAKMLLAIPVVLLCTVCFSQYTPMQKMVRVGNVITFKGNKIEVTPTITDTIIVTDPKTGTETKTITSRNPVPVKVNGVKVIFDVRDVDQNPVFKSVDGSLTRYIIDNIRKELEQLPDGKSYYLSLAEVTIGVKGDIVYYDYSGIFSNGKDTIPTSVRDKINRKLENLLYNTQAKPAKIMGKPVPLNYQEEKLGSWIQIKNHKIMNW